MVEIFLLEILRGCPKALQNTLLQPQTLVTVCILFLLFQFSSAYFRLGEVQYGSIKTPLLKIIDKQNNTIFSRYMN